MTIAKKFYVINNTLNLETNLLHQEELAWTYRGETPLILTFMASIAFRGKETVFAWGLYRKGIEAPVQIKDYQYWRAKPNRPAILYLREESNVIINQGDRIFFYCDNPDIEIIDSRIEFSTELAFIPINFHNLMQVEDVSKYLDK